MSLRWRAADGVASKGQDGRGKLHPALSFQFGPTPTFCKCLITSAKGRPGGTEIHHLVRAPPFLLATVQMQLVGTSNTGYKGKASNLEHCVSAKLGCTLLALRCSYCLTRPHRVVSSNRCWKHAERTCVFSFLTYISFSLPCFHCFQF